jgi:hypothetical protein
MKNLKTIGKAGIITLIMCVFFSANLMANGTSGEEGKKEKVKKSVEVEKLIAEIQKNEEFELFDEMLKEEGIIDCSNDTKVTILDANGELLYEGSQAGISITDKKLKKYVERADFLINVDNTAYYMIF